MVNENELDLDSQNQADDIVLEENDDVDVIREKFNKLSEKHTKVLGQNNQLFARTKKAEGFELKDGKWTKPEKPLVEPKPEPKPPATGELDETQLDYLDLKGISDPDEIDIIQKVIVKTGQTVRQALKDEYVVAKLDALKKDKEVKNATPSSTKRGGNNMTDDENYWFQKYEQDGKLPENMPKGMDIKLVNRKAAQGDVRRNPYE